MALKRPVVTKTSLRDQKDFEFYGIRRNTQRERERERGSVNSDAKHISAWNLVQFFRSEITASPFISTALARKIASANCTSYGTERHRYTERKTILHDFSRLETIVIRRETSTIVASPPICERNRE